MSETQDTPVIPEPGTPGETATPELGTEATTSTSDAKGAEDKVEVEDVAALRKELDKAKMRANQLENQQKEDELTRLKDTEDYKTLADKLQAELEERNAKDQQETERKAATEFRDKVISEFPEAVQKAAKGLIDKNPSNLLWKDAQDWDDAGTQLRDQLSALQEVMGVSNDEQTESGVKNPSVNANNPVPNLAGIDPETMDFEELKKVLPRSKRDF